MSIEIDESNLSETLQKAVSILSKHDYNENDPILESIKNYLLILLEDEDTLDIQNFFQSITNLIFLSTSSTKSKQTKSFNKKTFVLFPFVYSINPKKTFIYVDHFLTSLQKSINEENRQNFSYLSEIFSNFIKVFFNDNKNNNKNKENKDIILSYKKKEALYENLFKFCNDNIKINQRTVQSFGCLLLSELIEKCPLVKEEKNLGPLFKVFSGYLDDRWFECKLDLLNCTISLVFTAQEKFRPYANVCLFRVLDYLTDNDWMKRKLAINIVYTLVYYCKEEILAVKDNIIEFLNILKEDTVDEVREVCLQALKFIEEQDTENKFSKGGEDEEDYYDNFEGRGVDTPSNLKSTKKKTNNNYNKSSRKTSNNYNNNTIDGKPDSVRQYLFKPGQKQKFSFNIDNEKENKTKESDESLNINNYNNLISSPIQKGKSKPSTTVNKKDNLLNMSSNNLPSNSKNINNNKEENTEVSNSSKKRLNKSMEQRNKKNNNYNNNNSYNIQNSKTKLKSNKKAINLDNNQKKNNNNLLENSNRKIEDNKNNKNTSSNTASKNKQQQQPSQKKKKSDTLNNNIKNTKENSELNEEFSSKQSIPSVRGVSNQLKSKNSEGKDLINNNNNNDLSNQKIETKENLKILSEQLKKIQEGQNDLQQMINDLRQTVDNNYNKLDERVTILEDKYEQKLKEREEEKERMKNSRGGGGYGMLIQNGEEEENEREGGEKEKGEEETKIESIKIKFLNGEYNGALIEAIENDKYLFKILPLINGNNIDKIDISIIEDLISRLTLKLPRLCSENGTKGNISIILSFFNQLIRGKVKLKMITQLNLKDTLKFLKAENNLKLSQNDITIIDIILKSLKV